MLKKQYKVFDSEELTPRVKTQKIKIEDKEFVYSDKNIEIVSELISGNNHKFILRKLNDKIGEVHDGGATMDWMAQEKER